MPAKILTSIHGKLLGLGHRKQLIAPNGLLIGDDSGQTAVPSPIHNVIFDDFLQGFNTGTWLATEGTDSATSAAAVVSTGIGGVLRLTTGDAGTGYATDAEQITQNGTFWRAADNGLIIEARVSLSQITEDYFFLGFTDTTALEAPIISAGSGNTITTNATDAVGFMFDTRMSTDNWWLVGVANDVDATAQNSTFAPVVNTYEVLRIEIDTAGVAVFFRNGVQVGTAMSGAIRPSIALTPIYAFSKLSTATSVTADVDYVGVSKRRG